MMKTPVVLLLLSSVLVLAGCVNRYRHQEAKVIHTLDRKLLTDPPNFTFRSIEFGSGGGSGGSGPMLAYWGTGGEIVSADGSPLPSNFLDRLVQRIEAHLRSEGCTITENERGHGDRNLEANGVKNSNFEDAAIGFDFGESQGRVEIVLIERDYRPEGKAVVGQLMVTATQAR